MADADEQVVHDARFKWLVACITVVVVVALGALAFVTSQYVSRDQALHTQTQAMQQGAGPAPTPGLFSCANYNENIRDRRDELSRLMITLGCTRAGAEDKCMILWQLEEDLRQMALLLLTLCSSCPILTPTLAPTASPPRWSAPATPTPLRTPTRYIGPLTPPVE